MSNFNNDNREKGVFSSASDRVNLRVSRNSEYADNSAGVFLQMKDKYGTDIYASFALEDAKAIQEAIGSVLSDYDIIAAQVKTKNSRLLDSLPIGSVIQVNNETTRWYKKQAGWVVGPEGNYAETDIWFDSPYWEITVKYNPEED